MPDMQAAALGLGTVFAALFLLLAMVRVFAGRAVPPETIDPPPVMPMQAAEGGDALTLVPVIAGAIAAFRSHRPGNPMVRNYSMNP